MYVCVSNEAPVCCVALPAGLHQTPMGSSSNALAPPPIARARAPMVGSWSPAQSAPQANRASAISVGSSGSKLERVAQRESRRVAADLERQVQAVLGAFRVSPDEADPGGEYDEAGAARVEVQLEVPRSRQLRLGVLRPRLGLDPQSHPRKEADRRAQIDPVFRAEGHGGGRAEIVDSRQTRLLRRSSPVDPLELDAEAERQDRKSTRLNSSH